MPAFTDVGKMLAGIAFLLLALNFMESSLRHLAGRNFKLYLKKQTGSKITAIGSGAVVTGILQSSSIVNLLVLSMAGAGVLKMQNALALMLGANLGTTLNSWLVALFGFDFNIEKVSLLVTGIAGTLIAFGKQEGKLYLWLKFLFGFAFLFVALGFIRGGMEDFVKQTDLSAFSHFPLIFFLPLGLLLTALVQAGSVTMAITLSALYTGVISFHAAVAIILGSEIGTTLKLFLVSAGGGAIKKRLALGNFLFNFITVAVVLILLQPLTRLVTDVFGITDKLIALVIFQSFINVLSIIIFLPFLKQLGNFLIARYRDKEEEGFYINKIPVADTELAVGALENEVKHFISLVIHYCISSFKKEEEPAGNNIIHKKFYTSSEKEKYEYIKQLHGEMHSFYLKIIAAATPAANLSGNERLVSAMRNGMYAAKSIRDIQHDIEQVRNSSNDTKFGFYIQSAENSINIYQQLFRMVNDKNSTGHFEELTSLYRKVTAGYSEALQLLYKDRIADRLNETEISTLVNFNRELHTSYKSLLFSVKDYLLTVKEAEYFDAQPGFIR